jgi:hypothetical protein
VHQPEIPTSQSIAEDTSRALSNTLAALAMKLHARNIESECMIFNGNSVAKSPTMNIDSPNAVGASKAFIEYLLITTDLSSSEDKRRYQTSSK